MPRAKQQQGTRSIKRKRQKGGQKGSNNRSRPATVTNLSWFREGAKRAKATVRPRHRKRRFSATFVPGLPQHELRIITAGYPPATRVKPQPHQHTPHVPFVQLHTCRCSCNSPYPTYNRILERFLVHVSDQKFDQRWHALCIDHIRTNRSIVP